MLKIIKFAYIYLQLCMFYSASSFLMSEKSVILLACFDILESLKSKSYNMKVVGNAVLYILRKFIFFRQVVCL